MPRWSKNRKGREGVATIQVESVDGTTFDVTVEERTVTRHRVTVSPAYREKLTGDKMSAEELLRRSFEFLLEREPNTSILRSFDLPLIGDYFPEYEDTIRQGLK